MDGVRLRIVGTYEPLDAVVNPTRKLLKSGNPRRSSSSSLRSPHLSHIQIISSAPHPLQILNLRSSFTVTGHALHQAKTNNGKNYIFVFLIFTFLYSRWQI